MIKEKKIIKKTEKDDTTILKEKRTIKENIALQLAKAKGSTLAAAIGAPIFIVLSEGTHKLLDPACILTVILGLGLSLLCGWIAKKILIKSYKI